MRAIIIHGSYGSPEANWFPWLKGKLEEVGVETVVPRFPTPEGQSLGSWLTALGEYEGWFGSDLILVGHSIGCAFILRKLERISKPVCASFLVSGFAGRLGNEKFDSVNASFVDGRFDWGKIRRNCDWFEVLHSDNDPYVPLKFGEELAKDLGTKLTKVKGGGHLNAEAGYKEFPLLFEKISSML